MRRRYRYILSGIVDEKAEINIFRLIAANNIKPSYDGYTAIRVQIPNGLELDKWQSDPYSTTDDKRTIEELGYDVLIWNGAKKKWSVHNEYKGMNPCDIPLHREGKVIHA